MSDVRIVRDPPFTHEELNELFSASWSGHRDRDFEPVLARSLVTFGAYHGDSLVGFVHVAWDGECHAFVLDPTVHPDFRRRGVGRSLLAECAGAARDAGVEWLHVDYEPELEPFYRAAGYQPTAAGVLRL